MSCQIVTAFLWNVASSQNTIAQIVQVAYTSRYAISLVLRTDMTENTKGRKTVNIIIIYQYPSMRIVSKAYGLRRGT